MIITFLFLNHRPGSFLCPRVVGPVSDKKFTQFRDMLGSPINFMRIQEVGRDISG